MKKLIYPTKSKRCINPQHLRILTNYENKMRGFGLLDI